MTSGWTWRGRWRKSLLLLFSQPADAAAAATSGGGMPYDDPATAPRRWQWLAYGQQRLVGRGHVTRCRLVLGYAGLGRLRGAVAVAYRRRVSARRVASIGLTVLDEAVRGRGIVSCQARVARQAVIATGRAREAQYVWSGDSSGKPNVLIDRHRSKSVVSWRSVSGCGSWQVWSPTEDEEIALVLAVA